MPCAYHEIHTQQGTEGKEVEFALFMTGVCSTYICIAPEGLALSDYVSYIIGGLCTLVAAIGFVSWYRKQNSIVYEKI